MFFILRVLGALMASLGAVVCLVSGGRLILRRTAGPREGFDSRTMWLVILGFGLMLFSAGAGGVYTFQ